MSFVLAAIARDLSRRRDWGEAVWTAPDLFRPPVVFYAPADHVAVVAPTGFGYQTAGQIGRQELDS